jgi:hypothetical protein
VHRSGYLALITVVLGVLSGAADSVCQQQQSERNSLPTLTTAHDVHRLTSDHAAQNYPVHLRAVVTYCDRYIDPRHPTVWISDSSGGIYVECQRWMDSRLPTPSVPKNETPVSACRFSR